MDIDKQLMIGAVLKWIGGEALSLSDTERIIRLFEIDLRMDVPDQATIAGVQTRLRAILSAKYLGNQQK